MFFFFFNCLIVCTIRKEIDGADLSKSDADYLKEFAFGEVSDGIEIKRVYALKFFNLYFSPDYDITYVDFKVHDLSVLKRASSKLDYDFIRCDSKWVKDSYWLDFTQIREDDLHFYYEMEVNLGYHYNREETRRIARLSAPHKKVKWVTGTGLIPIEYVFPIHFGAPTLFLLLAGLFKVLESRKNKNTTSDKKG